MASGDDAPFLRHRKPLPARVHHYFTPNSPTRSGEEPFSLAAYSWDVLGEFLAHGEVKSATANGDVAGASSRGLLSRRYVTPSELRLIGKESNAIEAAEAGLIGDWASILSTYGDRTSTNAPSLELLMTAPAFDAGKSMERERPHRPGVAPESTRKRRPSVTTKGARRRILLESSKWRYLQCYERRSTMNRRRCRQV